MRYYNSTEQKFIEVLPEREKLSSIYNPFKIINKERNIKNLKELMCSKGASKALKNTCMEQIIILERL